MKYNDGESRTARLLNEWKMSYYEIIKRTMQKCCEYTKEKKLLDKKKAKIDLQRNSKRFSKCIPHQYKKKASFC